MTEHAKVLSELKEYIESFRKKILELDPGYSEEIPEFLIPNWPKEAGNVTVSFWMRKILYPYNGETTGKINVKPKRTLKVRFFISERGEIKVIVKGWVWSSGSGEVHTRVKCFIMFTQFLDELCSDIIEQLEKRYSRYKHETLEHRRVCEAVKKSFEPLIPFIVVDKLSQGAENESR